jgi:DNA-binding NtrC family response regulator
MPAILIVEDNDAIRGAVARSLKKHDCREVYEAGDLRSANKLFADLFDEDKGPVVVLLDIFLPDQKDGFTFLRSPAVQDRIARQHCAVIAMSAFADEEIQEEARQANACAFVPKAAAEASEAFTAVVRRETRTASRRLQVIRDFKLPIDVVGKNPALVEAYRKAFMNAYSEENFLIVGETGTGKERLAKWIHQCRDRAPDKFVSGDSSDFGTAPEMAKSALFGIEEGVATGVTDLRVANERFGVRLRREIHETTRNRGRVGTSASAGGGVDRTGPADVGDRPPRRVRSVERASLEGGSPRRGYGGARRFASSGTEAETDR